MPTTTREDRENRRAMVAFLDGLGVGPTSIAMTVGVSRQTVHQDRRILASRAGPLDAEQVTAQVRGVAGHLGIVVADLLRATRVVRDEKGAPMRDEQGALLQEPAHGIRLSAARTLWKIFGGRVALEQSLGAMPKAAEKVEVTIDVGEVISTVMKIMAVYMDPDTADVMARTLETLDDEQPGWLDGLLTR